MLCDDSSMACRKGRTARNEPNQNFALLSDRNSCEETKSAKSQASWQEEPRSLFAVSTEMIRSSTPWNATPVLPRTLSSSSHVCAICPVTPDVSESP